MSIPQARRVGSDDRAVEALWDALGTLRSWLAGRPHVDAVELVGVVLAGGAQAVPHTLGRRPRGWFVSRKSAFGDVRDGAPAANTSPALTLALDASAPMTVNLVVF